ncbi:MAG: ABC transporter substrate-binding protein [Anaerolineae bacterium]
MRKLSCLLLLALALSACGPLAAPTATPEPVEISFLYSGRALEPYYEELRDEFHEAYPHITVKLTETAFYEMLFRGPGAADVIDVDQTGIASLAKQGFLYALDPVVQGPDGLDLAQFYAGTVDAMRWQGKLWALPLGVDPMLLYYNKDIFDAKGISYPTNEWTWGDLVDAAARIAEPDADPPLWGIATDDRRSDYLSLLYQGGGGLVDNAADPQRSILADDASVAAMQWFVDLALAQRVMPTPRDARSAGGYQFLVVAEQTAMWYGALSERNGLSWDVPWNNFQWGAAAQPAGQVRTTVLTLRACAVNAETAHPREAWLWAKYLAEHPGGDYDAPALKAAVESDSFLAGEQADVVAAVRQALTDGQALPAVAWQSSFYMTLSRFLDAVFERGIPVADAMAELDAALNETLAQQGEGAGG